jgi:hypothetical protein
MNRVCCLALCFTGMLASVAAEEAKTPRTDLYGDLLPPAAGARANYLGLPFFEDKFKNNGVSASATTSLADAAGW